MSLAIILKLYRSVLCKKTNFFQFIHAILHKVKVINHLMIGHNNWVEDKEVQAAIKTAKGKVQEALKPGKVVGGSRDENIGVAFEYPDAKVSYQYSHNP